MENHQKNQYMHYRKLKKIKRKKWKKVLKEIITGNFPNLLGRNGHPDLWGSKKILNRINSKKIIILLIIILSKVND